MLDAIRPYLQYAPIMAMLLLLIAILYSAHKNSGSSFNVFDYFIDPVTKKASITKTLQVLAGLTATWAIIKFTAANNLTSEVFAIYLAAMGISEGWSKYIGAKFTPKE